MPKIWLPRSTARRDTSTISLLSLREQPPTTAGRHSELRPLQAEPELLSDIREFPSGDSADGSVAAGEAHSFHLLPNAQNQDSQDRADDLTALPPSGPATLGALVSSRIPPNHCTECAVCFRRFVNLLRDELLEDQGNEAGNDQPEETARLSGGNAANGHTESQGSVHVRADLVHIPVDPSNNVQAFVRRAVVSDGGSRGTTPWAEDGRANIFGDRSRHETVEGGIATGEIVLTQPEELAAPSRLAESEEVGGSHDDAEVSTRGSRISEIWPQAGDPAEGDAPSSITGDRDEGDQTHARQGSFEGTVEPLVEEPAAGGDECLGCGPRCGQCGQIPTCVDCKLHLIRHCFQPHTLPSAQQRHRMPSCPYCRKARPFLRYCNYMLE
jgi:hypothetical protein